MISTLRSNTKLAAWIVVGALAVVSSFTLAAYTIGQRENAAKDRLDSQRFAIHESCVAIQNLNTVITATLKRSRRNLPKLSYFQQNPRELRTQLAEIDRELVVFRPRTCR